MATEVVSAENLDKPIIRSKRLSAHNDGSMMAVIDAGEYASAVEKATAIKTRAVAVSDEIKAVQEKMQGLK